MPKRLVSVFILSLGISGAGLADDLWHCIAMTTTTKSSVVWNKYGNARESASAVIERECRSYNNNKSCSIVCFPPRVYWRCLSHDTPPVTRNTQDNPKQSTWYWTSFSKQIAVNGARDACRHNSAFGGCYVDPDACASS